MKFLAPFFALCAALAVIVTAVTPASADFPGDHPNYVHAMGDLRFAHALLNHGEYRPGVSGQEDEALADISHAYYEIKKAGIDDGKDIDAHDVDPVLDHVGRLHEVLEALHRAFNDVSREEQDPAAIGLRDHARRHISDAIVHVRNAIADIHNHV